MELGPLSASFCEQKVFLPAAAICYLNEVRGASLDRRYCLLAGHSLSRENGDGSRPISVHAIGGSFSTDFLLLGNNRVAAGGSN